MCSNNKKKEFKDSIKLANQKYHILQKEQFIANSKKIALALKARKQREKED